MERILMTVPAVPEMTSEILIGRGFPDPFLPARTDRRTAAIFTQPGRGCGRPAGASRRSGTAPLMHLPDRDEAKTLAVVEKAYRWLAEIPLGRHDTIVGVGGGAVTDMAGFVAATWLRGVESVMVPTTLLGAVDAAIGGKTGINLAGKNLVGAFHLPSRVIIDLDVIGPVAGDVAARGTGRSLEGRPGRRPGPGRALRTPRGVGSAGRGGDPLDQGQGRGRRWRTTGKKADGPSSISATPSDTESRWRPGCLTDWRSR